VRAGASRRLAGATAIVMAAYVSSRLSGLLRDIVVSYRFGTGREFDAYLAANRVPDLVFQIAAGAAVASAFIPVYSSYLARGDRDGGQRLVNALFTISVVGLLPIVIAVMIFAPGIMRLLVPGYPPDYQDLAANLSRIILFAPVFFTVGCFSTSVLNAHRRFLLAAIAPTTYNLGIIFGAAIFSRWLGISGLALGTLLGSIFFLAIQVPGLRQIGLIYRPRLDLTDDGVRRVGRLMGPRVLGLAVTQLNFVVTLYLASGIDGGVAALNYAWILTMLPLGVFAMAISTAVFPTLAEHSATSQLDDLRRTLDGAVRFIMYLMIPATVGLIVLSEPVVRLVYQRGQFTSLSTAMTADALRFYAAGLLGMATVEIVTRAFYALHDTRTPVKIAALGVAVNLGLGLILVRTMGLSGLALSLALASTIEAIVLFSIGQTRSAGLSLRDLVASAAKSLLAAAIMGVAVLAVSTTVAPLDRSVGGLAAVVASVIVGGAVYVALTAALGSSEIQQLRRLVGR
jgi:putative peptidoglycan lipid II flippase